MKPIPSALILATLAATAVACGASAQNSPDWTEPFPPFRIAGNLYYVGSKGLASYLVATPQGHILIDSGMTGMHDGITSGVERLG